MPPPTESAEIAQAELALERLFRLTVNRRVHAKQTAIVGADVTRAGYAILRTLAESGELPMGQLARRCSMDPAAANRQVRSLEDDELVERMHDADDGRLSVARLTAKGRRVYERIVALRIEHMTDVLDGWSTDDKANLIRIVDRLVIDLRSTPIRPTALRTTTRETK